MHFYLFFCIINPCKGGKVPFAAERKEGESFQSLLRRFNRKVQQSGILSIVRKKRFYEKPKTKREVIEEALRNKEKQQLKIKKLRCGF